MLKYSERAQRVVNRSMEEALQRGSGIVGPQHLLLACLSPEPGIAGGVGQGALQSLGVDLAALRTSAEAALPPPAPLTAGGTDRDLSFTPEGKAVIMDHAGRAAESLGHRYIGTEHLLLGLFAVPATASLLRATGAGQEALAAECLRLLGEAVR